MSEWREFHISELATSHSAARVPLSKMEREARRGNYPYYGASGVIDYVDNFLFDGEYVLVSEDGENLKTRQTPIAFKAKGKFWVNNHAHVMQGHTEWLNDLLVYYFQNLDLSEYLTGAVQPKLNKANLESIKFFLPVDPDEQRAIASVLSSLDAKIDLLHRQNKTLEAMAETLFRQWFVEEAEEGWEESNIYELINVIYGFPFKSKHFNEDRRGLPLIRIRDLKDGFSNIYTDETCDDKYVLQCGDLVAGMDGEFRLYIWSGSKAVLNQRACKFTPAHEYVPYMYVLNLMRPHLHYYENTKVGTTVIHLGKSDIDEIRVAVPPKELLLKYGAATDPMHKKIINNHTQLRSLTALRDTLLPKLMSGEVRVEVRTDSSEEPMTEKRNQPNN